MDFLLSEDHKLLRKVARDFASEEIGPIAAKIDETGEFPLETVMKMGELGLMGIQVDDKYGGAGMDAIAYVIAMIEISAVDASHGAIMSVNNSLYCSGIEKWGTEEQKKEFLVPVASGKKIASYALTEPQSGSDAGNMHATAVKDGDAYVINGVKSWITSAPKAKYILVFAQTDQKAKSRGVSAFIIDTEKEGFSLGKTEPKLGIRASATSEIHFEDYVCPESSLLGEKNNGFKLALSILDSGRIGIAAQAVGIARAAYDASVIYARDRHAFGQPIGKFQMIQQKIADMKVKLDASYLLTMNAARKKIESMQNKSANLSFSLEAASAKLLASRSANWIANEAVQIHGGMGYSKELPIERYYRDARITEIYEGTSEIMKVVIARHELGIK